MPPVAPAVPMPTTRRKTRGQLEAEAMQHLDGIRQQAMADLAARQSPAVAQQAQQSAPDPVAPTLGDLAGVANQAITRMGRGSNFNEYKQAGRLQQQALDAGATSAAQPGLPPKMGFEFAPGETGVMTAPAWNPNGILGRGRTTVRLPPTADGTARPDMPGVIQQALSGREMAHAGVLATRRQDYQDQAKTREMVRQGMTTPAIELARKLPPDQFRQVMGMVHPEAWAAAEQAASQAQGKNGMQGMIAGLPPEQQQMALGVPPEVIQDQKLKTALSTGQLNEDVGRHFAAHVDKANPMNTPAQRFMVKNTPWAFFGKGAMEPIRKSYIDALTKEFPAYKGKEKALEQWFQNYQKGAYSQ